MSIHYYTRTLIQYCKHISSSFKGECSVFKNKIIMDENDALSENTKTPLGHNRANGAVYFKVEICSAH